MKAALLRYLLVCGLALGFVSPIFANQRAAGYCTTGNQVVVTGSQTSTTKVMKSFPQCTVTVYATGTLNLATIYSDNAATPLGNPFTASSTGYWFFYAANGRYDVKLSGAGIPTPFTLADVLLADPIAPGSASWIYLQSNPFNDIRTFGAVCDGTNQNTAVQAAITAGAKQLFIPAGCMWIPPDGAGGALIPTNLVIWGENYLTSVIKSSATPAGKVLYGGPHTTLYNINAEGSGCNLPGGVCPITVWSNQSDINASVVSTGYGTFHSVSGMAGLDITGIFGQTEDGLGDAGNFSALGAAVGNALRTDCYDSCAASIFVGRENTAPGISIVDVTATHGGPPTSGPAIAYFTTVRTSGNFIAVNQRTSTDTGTLLQFDMADISGTYTGIFLQYTNGGVVQLQFGNDGSMFIPVKKSTTGTRYACWDTNGQLLSQTTACSGT